ncbi:MAG: hypothetical protein U0807_18915 [Candidatus Binatia bacterium]
MIRLACTFGLLALAVVVALAIRPEGRTAILFSFVGVPALGIALALYGAARWRAGGFGPDRPSGRRD